VQSCQKNERFQHRFINACLLTSESRASPYLSGGANDAHDDGRRSCEKTQFIGTSLRTLKKAGVASSVRGKSVATLDSTQRGGSLKKAGHQADRRSIEAFQQIINVGPAMQRDFLLLGLACPQQLHDRDPWQLYCDLCRRTGTRQDPCVLDVLLATVDYMSGNPPRPWWDYTAERKRVYSGKLAAFTKTLADF